MWLGAADRDDDRVARARLGSKRLPRQVINPELDRPCGGHADPSRRSSGRTFVESSSIVRSTLPIGMIEKLVIPLSMTACIPAAASSGVPEIDFFGIIESGTSATAASLEARK